MGKVWDVIKNTLVGADEYDDEYDDMHMEEESVSAPQPIAKSTRTPAVERPERARGTLSTPDWRVMGNDTNRSTTEGYQRRMRIVKATPLTIEDARVIVENIKKDIVTFVDLTGQETVEAQRIADFLAGAICALDGSIARVNNESFMVGPQSVELFEYQEELKEKSKASFGGFGFSNL